MRKLVSLVLVSAGVCASPAMAQEANPSFTGPRVEGVVGYDNLASSLEGLLYGGAVGFDFAAGGFLVGAEGEYTSSTGDEQNTDRTDLGDGLRARLRTGRDLYAGVRAGFVASTGTMLYVKGGYTNAKVKFGIRDNADVDFNQNLKLDGYRIGGGIEQALEENAYVKLEYRYSNYSNAELSFADDFVEGDIDVDADRHQVVLGFGVRF